MNEEAVVNHRILMIFLQKAANFTK